MSNQASHHLLTKTGITVRKSSKSWNQIGQGTDQNYYITLVRCHPGGYWLVQQYLSIHAASQDMIVIEILHYPTMS